MPRIFSFAFFIVALLSGLPLAGTDQWRGVEKVVAIGDVHGDYSQLFTLLQQTGLVDEHADWTGGKAHLVQTGDIPDRGPDTRKIMDLLMRLEKQARKAGGYVHALIGNHDAMNLYGDLRYATPAEFGAFAGPKSEQIRNHFRDEHIRELKRKARASGTKPQIDEAARQQWLKQRPLGYFEQRAAFGPNGKYGKWIRKHNTVIKVNDSLFLHGGISPRFAEGSIRHINETVRAELKDLSLLENGITIASDGPLWYRGLAQGKQSEEATLVDTVLSHYRVKRIVTGHTPTAGTVMTRFSGKVLLIDVGLSKAYGRRLACLVIEDGAPYVLHRGRRIELPDGSKSGLLTYLKQAAALDPAPSPLASLIQRLETASGACR